MTIADEIKSVSRELRKRKGSPRVSRVEIEPRFDSTGDPSLYVWVILPDGTPESEQTLEKVQPIYDHVKALLRDMGETRWAYVHFKTESEYREMVEQ